MALKLDQLVNITSPSIRKNAARLRILHFKTSDHSSYSRYSAVILGSTGTPRQSEIILQKTGAAQVRCSCEYFIEKLKVPLAAHQSLDGSLDSVDRKNRLMRGRMVPGLCSHLLKLALLVKSTTATKREAKKSANITVSSKLRGL